MNRAELRAHLIRHRLAGPDIPTPRQKNLRSYRLFGQGDPGALMGLDPERRWGPGAVLDLMAERCGVHPDFSYGQGPDTIDPERTLDGLDRLAALVRRTARRRGTVLAGTGHPTKLTGFHAALARALEAAGCTLRTPARGTRFREPTPDGTRTCTLDYVRSVAVVRALDAPPSRAGRISSETLLHTHSAQPVRLALAALTEAGEPLPDLVLGDHGWLCGAGRLGIPAGGFADSNDPAPFVGEAEGTVEVVVPVDDGARPECYRALSDYVLQRADLAPYKD
ncbi:phosphatase [Kitasatospora atroaurantiaca]|uniref:Histidinol phosphate phosphatase hisN-like protein n=1 Tax=Kitasatospora atroaurantiaca TaxID=285545 RepID=A0A561EQW7_9ACTN|nr:phosphatase [Kitasatospora atroaurantiaca]TWE18000.1 histidinol phosphate phosphatase hisN-like protein [Kitasatospora atroaurantiaca]